jgi:hypothetical protein
MKRILLAVCLLVVMCSGAWADEPTKTAAKPTSAKNQADMMKAEMAKCAVCKNMAAHLDEIGPIQTEVVRLNDGVALIHSVSPSKADVFHKAGAEVAKAGEACMTMTDAQAKTQLCSFCQELRGVMKAGAEMSNGNTKYGDLMVITAKDPAVQTKIGSLASKCEMMMTQQQATR